MKLDTTLLDKITAQAKESPRLRMNYNLHESLEDNVQRLFNALEPGTIVPIHRHQNTSETYIVVRGKLRIRLFNDKKEQLEETLINPLSDCFGYHVPKGQWHTVESLESGTVLFEIKEGPYAPLNKEDML